MFGCKTSSILMESNLKLTIEFDTKLVDPGKYQRFIERVLYLTYTSCWKNRRRKYWGDQTTMRH